MKLQDPLKEKDIQLRIGTTSVGSGFSILLYKDARADVRRLTEVFGLSWQNNFRIDGQGHLICSISVFDGKNWISREDVGTESNIEKIKGAHSDAFKRAGFKFGIGAELYDAPFIWCRWSNWDGKKPKGAYLNNWSIKFEGKKLSDGFKIFNDNNEQMFSTFKKVMPPQNKSKGSQKKGSKKSNRNVSKKEFDRNAFIGVGKMSNTTWRDADDGYLKWAVRNTDGWLKKFAAMELDIREREDENEELYF